MDKHLRNMLLCVLALAVIGIGAVIVPPFQIVCFEYLLLTADVIASGICLLNAMFYVLDSLKLAHK